MEKIVIFGAGTLGKSLGKYILKTENEIVAFIDNNKNLCNIMIKGHCFDVKRVTDLKNMNFDKIIISNASKNAVSSIKEQIIMEYTDKINIEVLIEEEYFNDVCIEGCDSYDEFEDKRVSFLRNFAKYCYQCNMQGNVAECGVFLGGFSLYINKYFSDKKLYMFDTFEGFDFRDLNREYEIDEFSNANLSNYHFNTNFDLIDTVKKRMKYIDKCEIRKGWFPESAVGLEDIFCFVNLDMDLYAPTYEGIKFFYNKMVKGGVILLHDYFSSSFLGVKKAVYDFEKDNNINLVKIPIGDDLSLAIIKV